MLNSNLTQPTNGNSNLTQPANGNSTSTQPANGSSISTEPANGDSTSIQPANGNQRKRHATEGSSKGKKLLKTSASADAATAGQRNSSSAEESIREEFRPVTVDGDYEDNNNDDDDDDGPVDMDQFDARWSKRSDVRARNTVSIILHAVFVKAVVGFSIAGLIFEGDALSSQDCATFRALLKGQMELQAPAGIEDRGTFAFAPKLGFAFIPEKFAKDPFFEKTKLYNNNKPFKGWMTLNSVTKLKNFVHDPDDGREEDIMFQRVIWFFQNYAHNRVFPETPKALQIEVRRIEIGGKGFGLWQDLTEKLMAAKDEYLSGRGSAPSTPLKSNFLAYQTKWSPSSKPNHNA